MTGTVALIGGGEFRDTAELDRNLLTRAGVDEVLIVPTADAFERPDRLVAAGVAWFTQLGAQARGLAMLARSDAQRPEVVDQLVSARFVYLVGDSPMHLRSVCKDTPAWEALLEALGAGAVVAASGGAAMALSDPMTDPRGGAFTLGLGMVRPLAVVPQAESWSHDRLHRTLKLAKGFPLVTLPTGSAVVRGPDGWTAFGAPTVHQDGHDVTLDALPR